MKTRVKKYDDLFGLGMTSYHVECQEIGGNWIGFAKTISRDLGKIVQSAIKKNPNLVHGRGYLFR